jgi:hypothetical protein
MLDRGCDLNLAFVLVLWLHGTSTTAGYSALRRSHGELLQQLQVP